MDGTRILRMKRIYTDGIFKLVNHRVTKSTEMLFECHNSETLVSLYPNSSVLIR